MKIIIVISIIFVFSSCYTYRDGRLIPLFGKFKLKNKNTLIPERLDTNNLYKLKIQYENGELVYSDTTLLNHKKISFNYSFQKAFYYLEFYGNGRCRIFSIERFDFYGNKIKLTEEDLNPNNFGNTLYYYYFKDETNFQIETFTKGDGGGAYVILDYELSLDGKKVIYRDKNVYEEYEIYKIPENWKKYSYNW